MRTIKGQQKPCFEKPPSDAKQTTNAAGVVKTTKHEQGRKSQNPSPRPAVEDVRAKPDAIAATVRNKIISITKEDSKTSNLHVHARTSQGSTESDRTPPGLKLKTSEQFIKFSSKPSSQETAKLHGKPERRESPRPKNKSDILKRHSNDTGYGVSPATAAKVRKIDRKNIDKPKTVGQVKGAAKPPTPIEHAKKENTDAKHHPSAVHKAAKTIEKNSAEKLKEVPKQSAGSLENAKKEGTKPYSSGNQSGKKSSFDAGAKPPEDNQSRELTLVTVQSSKTSTDITSERDLLFNRPPYELVPRVEVLPFFGFPRAGAASENIKSSSGKKFKWSRRKLENSNSCDLSSSHRASRQKTDDFQFLGSISEMIHSRLEELSPISSRSEPELARTSRLQLFSNFKTSRMQMTRPKSPTLEATSQSSSSLKRLPSLDLLVNSLDAHINSMEEISRRNREAAFRSSRHSGGGLAVNAEPWTTDLASLSLLISLEKRRSSMQNDAFGLS